MEYRALGRTGLKVSAISMGCWATIGEVLDDEQTTRLLECAYEVGINFFDSAETYSNGAAEAALGRSIRRLAWPRETFLLSGKVFWGVHGKRPNTWGLSRKHVIEGCHASLRRLGVDYLDIYLCHRHDPDTPLAETVRAMSDLVSQGKVLYWGTSEWPADLVLSATEIAGELGLVPPQIEQLQYNLLVRERVEGEFAALHRKIGLGITTWSPLAYGLLAGRYDHGIPASARLARTGYGWLRESVLGADEASVLGRVRSFSALARDIGSTPSRVALAWVLRNATVSSAITGASGVEQLRDSVRALETIELLDSNVLSRVDRLISPAAAPATYQRQDGR
jgi:voltage-dependent potassium channel beta subunit